jgi:hypothetical protein
VSQVVAFSGTSEQVQLGLTGFWLVGSLVPIVASFLWMRTQTFTGLVASFAVMVEAVDVAPVLCSAGSGSPAPRLGFW